MNTELNFSYLLYFSLYHYNESVQKSYKRESFNSLNHNNPLYIHNELNQKSYKMSFPHPCEMRSFELNKLSDVFIFFSYDFLLVINVLDYYNDTFQKSYNLIILNLSKNIFLTKSSSIIIIATFPTSTLYLLFLVAWNFLFTSITN